jgi:hypothetical protein
MSKQSQSTRPVEQGLPFAKSLLFSEKSPLNPFDYCLSPTKNPWEQPAQETIKFCLLLLKPAAEIPFDSSSQNGNSL